MKNFNLLQFGKYAGVGFHALVRKLNISNVQAVTGIAGGLIVAAIIGVPIYFMLACISVMMIILGKKGRKIEEARASGNDALLMEESLVKTGSDYSRYIKRSIEFYSDNRFNPSFYDKKYLIKSGLVHHSDYEYVLFSVDGYIVTTRGAIIDNAFILLEFIHKIEHEKNNAGLMLRFGKNNVLITDESIFGKYFDDVRDISKKLHIILDAERVKNAKEKQAKQKEIERERIAKLNEDRRIETERLNEMIQKEKADLRDSINKLLTTYDPNADGCVDVEDYRDFLRLVEKYQPSIIEMDEKYVRDFLRVNNFLALKNANLNAGLGLLRKAKDKDDLVMAQQTLNAALNTYKITLLHSISMVSALVSKDMISFYEVYEVFDKNGLFDSHHEVKMQELLKGIGDEVKGVSNAIRKAEITLGDNLIKLAYLNNANFAGLRNVIDNHLGEISSQISYSNILQTFQTYKLHKIQKNTNETMRLN